MRKAPPRLREEVGAEPFRRKYLKENQKEKMEEEGNVPELPDVVHIFCSTYSFH